MGAHKVDDPRGLKIDWKKLDERALGKLLHDPRPAVRLRVMDHIEYSQPTILYDVAVAALTADTTERGILAAVWLLARDGRPPAFKLVGSLSLDRREAVRLAAQHVISLDAPYDQLAEDKALRGLTDNSLRVRRAAAGALGRMRDGGTVPAILTALADEKNDRELDHALTYALIEIGNAAETGKGLKSPSPRVRRACLAALENIPNSGLDTKAVFAELDAKDAALRDTAWWIAGRHPQWGDVLAGYFKDRFKQIEKMTLPEQDELVSRAMLFAKTDAVRKAVGDALSATPGEPGQRAILRGLAKSGLKVFPAEWKDGVILALYSRSDEVVRGAILVLRSVPPGAADFRDIVEKVSKYRERNAIPLPKELGYALHATGPAGKELPPEPAAAVIADLHRDRPGPVRAAAADWLTRAALTEESLIALAGVLKTVTPLEMPKLLGVFAKSKSEKVGLALVAALRDPKVRPAVRAEVVKPILDKYPQVKTEAEKLYAELAEARKGETARLEKLLKDMPTGDIRRGQLVFNSAKTNCIACHKVGYVGGTAAPDLTRIGNIRTERDLLESILFPSASFVRSYEPYRVVTKDDRTLNGVLKKDAPDEIIIVVAADKEERVSRADIESIAPSTISLMPAGLEQQLTRQELADLIAFLRACK
jgi:putative heme-binding domain-containing protein